MLIIIINAVDRPSKRRDPPKAPPSAAAINPFRRTLTMTDNALFQPYALGPLTLSNRIVMAPLTRNRAEAGFVPSRFAATYYSQRASAGLLIAEATQISQQGQGYQDTPGIYTAAQVEG